MFKKTKEVKVMRDVIHGYIHVELQVIWDLINAKEFQRLRRIRQLGGDYQVYHNAEHSRFSHSLGVYEITRRMIVEVKDLQQQLSEEDQVCVMIAALLHDIGHLPFSHAFENVCSISHEVFSSRIIEGDSEIHRILNSVDSTLANKVSNIIKYQHENPLLNQIISGELDADRMDYLLRDAYFTGTSYGAFDLERILRTIRARNQKLVVKESGVHSVENYIMARYHMYWQVYYHPVCQSYEFVLMLLFERMKALYDQGNNEILKLEMFLPFLGNNPTIQDHFLLDEHAAYYGFHLLSQGNDVIAADLASRLLNRKLFEYVRFDSQSQLDAIKQEVEDNGFDPTYYIKQNTTSQSPYRPYGKTNEYAIWVVDEQQEVVELSEKSVIVKALVQADVKEEQLIFFPSLEKES